MTSNQSDIAYRVIEENVDDTINYCVRYSLLVKHFKHFHAT